MIETPLNIANARLARGEISVDEHAELVKRLAASTPPASQIIPPALPPPVPPSVPPAPPLLPAMANAGAMSNPAIRKRPVWPWIVGGVAVVFALVVGFGLATVNGLSLGNLQASGQQISFRLANSGSKSGDVLLWIEQDDMKKCERIIRVRPSWSYNVTFNCPTLVSGKFTLQPQWAEYDTDTAAIAERIDVTN